MILKKNIYILTILCFINFNNVKGDEFDDAIEQATSDADTGKQITHEKKELTYIDVLNQILGFKINEILAKDFYKKTHTVIKRPVLTLPIFNLYHTDHTCQDWLFRFFLFGNATSRAFFTGNSPLIKSFIAVDDKDILEIIEDLVPEAPKILEHAKNIKKQERRGGLMFQSLMNFNDLSLEIDVPFFYEERNYFLTQREKEELEEAFGGKTEKEQERELRKHAVADKIGIGDARIKLGYSALKKNNICLKAGVQSTLPIAFAFKKGIIGSNFKKVTKQPPPSFDFKRVFELIDDNQDELVEEFRDFGITAADWLSAIVLDDPLGNSGHFGLGLFVEPQIKINEGVSLKILGSIEYFFTKKERRYFLKCKNKELFKTSTLEKDLDNEQDAKRAVEFLNQQVINTLFPSLIFAEITPGFIAQVTVGPQFKLNDWNFSFGYDFWFQAEEKINSVSGNPFNLNINKAIKDRAFSNKLFASLTYTRLKPYSEWSFLLNVEHAFCNEGVGRDFSVALGFEFNY